MRPVVGSPISRRMALCAIWAADEYELSAIQAAELVEQIAYWLDRDAFDDNSVTVALGGSL